MSYTTQMDAARQGIITPQMEAAAKKRTDRGKRTPENLWPRAKR